MNQRQFASVLFSVVGVFLAVSRIPEIVINLVLIAQSATAGQESGVSGKRLLSVAAFGASLLAAAIGVTLLVYRDRVAQRLFPTVTAPLETRAVQTAAFAVLGCYFVVQGISRFGWSGQVNWAAAIQLTLGVALFLGAQGLSRLWSLAHLREKERPAERVF